MHSDVGPVDFPMNYGGRFWDVRFGLSAEVPIGALKICRPMPIHWIGGGGHQRKQEVSMKQTLLLPAALLPIVFASLLPIAAQAECKESNLKGRWVAMIAGEHSGLWQQCDLRIASSGRATGSCLLSDGGVAATDPIQFRVNGDCSVTGESQTGFYTYSLRIQKGKRGAIGRVVYDDGDSFFSGPLVAAKRG
ncbi:MAG: hypothetical protein M3495_22110 [Pseudomonadota bacterium]|nr:hypothetical protein [Gammaproteobacteria bacterium]MDQ3584120.1 hypothetical protein [Pseudomonadota bacterium]